MGPSPRPGPETDIDEALVASLVRAQHPDLDGPVRLVATGWDNAVLRLGADLAVRMPRRRLGADLVANELRWLPQLAGALPLDLPTPVRAGEPGLGYPWRWSIVRWVHGETALAAGELDEWSTLRSLLHFLRALQVPAPADAPRNPYRGVPLAERSSLFERHLALLGDRVDGVAARAAWRRCAAEPPWSGPAGWVHGDLHPGNLVVNDGVLTGVIDFGDLTAGDPATDLAVAWMLFGAEARDAVRTGIPGLDDATWGRARGWALAHSVAVLAHSADDPDMAAMGQRTLDAVLTDAETAP